MRVRNHKVEGLTFQKAHFIGGEITPAIVVLHDTASRLELGRAADYLASKNTDKVSVHFVVERDGTITQQVPTNRRANHAGASSYHGRAGCNDFAIGIEIVNPGRLTRGVGGMAISWWGEEFGHGAWQLAEMTTPQHGPGTWMPYTTEQVEALTGLMTCLFRDIPSLTDITTHWYVSPGRKIDTNPLFPLEQVRARILGHDEPAEAEALAGSEPVAQDDMVAIDAGGDSLNLRRWPSFNPNVIAAIPDGTVVPVLRDGDFSGRRWLRVLYAGREGWILARYAAPVVFA